MFIYNIKMNGSKTFKTFFAIVTIFIIIVLGIVVYKIFNGAKNSFEPSGCLPKNNVTRLNSNNYTNVLKIVHENIDTYVGRKINFTGYVYRVSDLKENQFVISRDMVISSDFQTVVVGFLCEYNKAKEFSDNSWVEITGEIIKGDYHGDMPIIKITEIKNTNKPNDELVYPPDDSYIPTSDIL